MRSAVILAGGTGTRLWPLSRRNAPKQVRALLDEETLLQKTFRRLHGAFSPEQVFISTLAAYADDVRLQVPEVSSEHFLLEPLARDTAAAIGYAALRLSEQDSNAIFVTINADAYVGDVDGYLQAIDDAFTEVESGTGIALVGIPPTAPETGYGYIELAGPAAPGHGPVPVVRFVEKPDAATAEEYLHGGRHLWNPALFVIRASHLLDRFSEHLPEHHRALMTIRGVTNRAALHEAFLRMPSVSIDVGIMEQLQDLVVIPASFPWADIGNWRSVYDVLAMNSMDNVVRGTHCGIASAGNLVVAPADKVVATCGIEDCVIIDTSDALLVCRKDRAHEVRGIVQELERRGLTAHL